jgi:hypothetical protein
MAKFWVRTPALVRTANLEATGRRDLMMEAILDGYEKVQRCDDDDVAAK